MLFEVGSAVTVLWFFTTNHWQCQQKSKSKFDHFANCVAMFAVVFIVFILCSLQSSAIWVLPYLHALALSYSHSHNTWNQSNHDIVEALKQLYFDRVIAQMHDCWISEIYDTKYRHLSILLGLAFIICSLYQVHIFVYLEFDLFYSLLWFDVLSAVCDGTVLVST